MPRTAVKNAALQMPAYRGEIRETPGLGFMLREAYRAFSRELTCQLDKHGISYSQWIFLWFLYERDSLSPLEFAKLANIQKSSVTGVLDAMQSQGFVTTRSNEKDARQLIVRLTPHGLSTVKKLFSCAVDANRLITSALSESEIVQLMLLLGKVVNSLNDGTRQNSIIVKLKRKRK